MPDKVGPTLLTLVLGDITQQKVDAVVNAANSGLLGGGGVDGAIHAAGGAAVTEACRKIRAERGLLPPGEAVITTGGKLPAPYVIHTVGPVWQGGNKGEPETLARAYKSSLELASAYNLKTLAFPAISTGAYGYPITKAAEAALKTLSEELPRHNFQEIRLVLFSPQALQSYQKIFWLYFN